MKLKPLQDWAVIQRIEPKEKTAAGIIIPDTAKDTPTEGIVLAIGPGKYKTEKGEEKKKEKEKEKKFIATVLRPGQRVIYGKYSAREFELDGETIVLVREEDVLGTVDETQLAEKEPFAVAEKHANPLAVKKEGKVMTVAAPPVQKKEPGEKKTIKKEKRGEKKEKKNVGTGKIEKKVALKLVKKVSGKKTTGKKTVTQKAAQKPVKKTTPVKKVKAAERKVVAKKAAVKKSIQKKTDIPKKKVVQKKTTVKVSKKTVRTKAVTAKKKQTAKKPLAKIKAKTKK